MAKESSLVKNIDLIENKYPFLMNETPPVEIRRKLS